VSTQNPNILVKTILVAMAASGAMADTLIVPNDHPTINAAILAAQDGDTIRVRSGTYAEGPLTFAGKALLIESFDGPTLTVITPMPGVKDTIITIRGQQDYARLSGFTISGGSGSNGDGGGIEILGTATKNPFDPTIEVFIEDCILLGNSSDTSGGGIHAAPETRVEITDCVFRSNSASTSGGGAFLECANHCLVLRTRFEGNIAGTSAGALEFGSDGSFEQASTFLAESCIFTGNVSGWVGGAIVATPESMTPESSCMVLNCTFSGNVSPRDPAIHTTTDGMQEATTRIINSILSRNAGIQGLLTTIGPDEFDIQSGNEFSHCLFDAIDDADLESGDELIRGEAGFSSEFGPDQLSGTGDENFRLSPISIAIDRGNASVTPESQTDVYGADRNVDDPLVLPAGTPGPIDLGASEFDTGGLTNRLAVWNEPGSLGMVFMQQSNWFEEAAPAPGLAGLVRTPGANGSAFLSGPGLTDDLTFDGGAMYLFASSGAPSGTGLLLEDQDGHPALLNVKERLGETTRLMIEGLLVSTGGVELDGGSMSFDNVTFRMIDGDITLDAGASVDLYGDSIVMQSGTLETTIVNHGRLFTSRTQVEGHYTQSTTTKGSVTSPSGFLGIQVAANDDESSAPDLDLTGSATLGGTLGIRGSENGIPDFGVQVPVIRAGSISGAFELLVGRDLPDALSIRLAISESVVGGSSEATIETIEGSDTVFDDAFFEAIAPGGIEDAILCDVDDDGDDDLIVSLTNTPGEPFSHVAVLENLGTGSGGAWNGFDTLALGINTIKISGTTNGLAVGDLDSDGRIDAVVTNKASGTVHVLQNASIPGTILFNEVLSESTSVDLPAGSSQPTDAWIGDLDLDGRPEVVVNNGADGGVVTFRNVSSLALTLGSPSKSTPTMKIRKISPTGTGKSRNEVPFGAATDQKNADGGATEGESADVEDDEGVVEVGKTTSPLQGIVRLEWEQYSVGEEPVDAASGDLDGDNHQDIVTANRSGESISILFGNGSGGYDPSVTIAVEDECLATNLGDFDGDGDLDIAVLVSAGATSTSVRVLRNDTDLTGTPTFCLESDSLFEGNGVNRIIVGRLDDDAIDDILVTAVAPSVNGPIPGWMAALGGVDASCFADIDGDGSVDATDLAFVLGSWGPVGSNDPSDLNQDLMVDATDLAFVLGNWGACNGNQLED
jgi:hypothetical protein